MIGVPRNFEHARFSEGSPLYGPFPNGYDCGDQCLISYLYTYGQEHPDLYPDAKAQGSQPGIEATRDAVSGVLGIELQYYALIDMQGFSDLVDALGGITIDVKKRLPIGGDENAQGQPINVDGWIEPGVRKLSGYNALWYARARHGSNDFDRMARQRDVQEAILKQFTPTVVLTKFQAIAEAGKQIVKTDIPSVMLGVLRRPGREVADPAGDPAGNRAAGVQPGTPGLRPDRGGGHRGAEAAQGQVASGRRDARGRRAAARPSPRSPSS